MIIENTENEILIRISKVVKTNEVQKRCDFCNSTHIVKTLENTFSPLTNEAIGIYKHKILIYEGYDVYSEYIDKYSFVLPTPEMLFYKINKNVQFCQGCYTSMSTSISNIFKSILEDYIDRDKQTLITQCMEFINLNNKSEEKIYQIVKYAIGEYLEGDAIGKKERIPYFIPNDDFINNITELALQEFLTRAVNRVIIKTEKDLK